MYSEIIANEVESLQSTEVMASNIRKHIIETCLNYGDGHAGPSLSCTDILAVLYSGILNVDPKNPKYEDRDYFILSAGHKCLGLYGALIESGFEDKDVLSKYNQLDSIVPGHPDATKFRGVDFSTGSLGHGLGLACGVAMGMKLKNKDSKVFVLMGDGEQGEGSIWESASVISHHGLDNIVAIIDRNGLQINGTTEEIQNLDKLKERYEAFGWSVEYADGHNIYEIHNLLTNVPFVEGKPSLVIANTTKGKGLSFAENNISYHHWNPKDPVEIQAAYKDLEKLSRGWK